MSPAPPLGTESGGAPDAADSQRRIEQLEETLRVTEQQLLTTLRAIGDAVISTDAAGRITFMNTIAESLTGWPGDEARGQPIDRVFRVADEPSPDAAGGPVARVLREGAAVGRAHHTLRLRDEDTELFVDDSAAPLRDSKGALVGVVLVFRDLTEKRRGEGRRAFLAELSEQLLGAALEYDTRLAMVAELAVPRLADWAAIDMVGAGGALERVAVAHVDPRKVERVAELQRRYPADPAAPRGVHAIVRTGRSELVPEVTDEMLVAGARDAEHLRLVREIGLRSYLGVPLIARGRTIGAITFATAETHRRYGPDDLAFAEDVARRAATSIDNARLHAESEEARATAEAAEQRFRALAEAIPQIVWAVEPDGRHSYLGSRWFAYTGQSPDETPEERRTKAVHPDDQEECSRRWEEAAASGVPWQMEYRLRRADGVYRWHLGRAVPHREGGRIVKWYGTATDIDEQKRAIRARDDLMATVSHDLRNPLGAILLSASLLQEGEEDVPRIAGAIQRSAGQMETLIKDLLDIAAIEQGELSITREPHDTGALVAEAVSLQAPLATQKGVTLRLAPAGEEAVVRCDRARVLQLFANLIGNALKFTPAGGSVTVSSAVASGEARFSVADTGPGVPAARRARVFDRFWRDRRSANAGTGLGLAICKGIVEQHGGRIWIEGREGEGATFVFTLPLELPG